MKAGDRAILVGGPKDGQEIKIPPLSGVKISSALQPSDISYRVTRLRDEAGRWVFAYVEELPLGLA